MKEKLKELKEVLFNQDLDFTMPWFIDVLAERRDELMKHHKEQKIGTRVMYPPLNRQKAYNLPGDYTVSDIVGEKGLWLPSASQLTDEDIIRVTEAIIDFYNTRA